MKVASALQAILYVSALALGVSAEQDAGETEQLQIGVKFKPDSCPIKSQNGDKLQMHYTGTLANGDKFDSSLDRGKPFEFVLGAGRVIKGWDQGLQDMCVGEKRKLRIPSKLGYGSRGSPPKIPGGSTLVFDVELLEILNRKPLPHEAAAASEPVVDSSSSSSSVASATSASASSVEAASSHESTTTQSATTSSAVEASTTAEPTSSAEAAEETHSKDEL